MSSLGPSLLFSPFTTIKGCFSEYLFGRALSSPEPPWDPCDGSQNPDSVAPNILDGSSATTKLNFAKQEGPQTVDKQDGINPISNDYSEFLVDMFISHCGGQKISHDFFKTFLQDYLKFFPNMGGGSSQIPKLLEIDQVFFCIPNSF